MPGVARFDDAELGKILEVLGRASGVRIAAEVDVDLSQRISMSEGNIESGRLFALLLERLGMSWSVQGDYVVVRNPGGNS